MDGVTDDDVLMNMKYGDGCGSHEEVYDDLLTQVSLSPIIAAVNSSGDVVGVVVDRNLPQHLIKVHVIIHSVSAVLLNVSSEGYICPKELTKDENMRMLKY